MVVKNGRPISGYACGWVGARQKTHVATLAASFAHGVVAVSVAAVVAVVAVVVVVVASVVAAAVDVASAPLSTNQAQEVPLALPEVRLLELPGILVLPRLAEPVDVQLGAVRE